MPQAPIEIQFEPKTLIIFIILTVISIVILAKGKKD